MAPGSEGDRLRLSGRLDAGRGTGRTRRVRVDERRSGVVVGLVAACASQRRPMWFPNLRGRSCLTAGPQRARPTGPVGPTPSERVSEGVVLYVAERQARCSCGAITRASPMTAKHDVSPSVPSAVPPCSTYCPPSPMWSRSPSAHSPIRPSRRQVARSTSLADTPGSRSRRPNATTEGFPALRDLSTPKKSGWPLTVVLTRLRKLGPGAPGARAVVIARCLGREPPLALTVLVRLTVGLRRV